MGLPFAQPNDHGVTPDKKLPAITHAYFLASGSLSMPAIYFSTSHSIDCIDADVHPYLRLCFTTSHNVT